MKLVVAGAVLVALTALPILRPAFSFGADKPEAKPKLTLTLKLAKTRWKVGEYLWYRLELRNDGPEEVQINDMSWLDARYSLENFESRRFAYLHASDTRGRPVQWEESPLPWNPYWISDDYPLPDYGAIHPIVSPFALKPGEFVTTAPSLLRWRAAQRTAPPSSVYGAAGYRGRVRGPDGFRILAGRWIEKPGRYVIQGHVDQRGELPDASADDEIARLNRTMPRWMQGFKLSHADEKRIRDSWKALDAKEVAAREEYRKRREEANETAPFTDSNVVYFEVVP